VRPSQTILICDDSELTRRLIAAGLESEGYDLREASNGEEALQQISDAQPDLVILDVHMPRVDGPGVIEQIRGNPELAATRFLLVSGSTEAFDEQGARAVGADAHLAKPFLVDALRDTVRALVSE
jgi:two-component system chemotaxis response regulator CheY